VVCTIIIFIAILCESHSHVLWSATGGFPKMTVLHSDRSPFVLTQENVFII